MFRKSIFWMFLMIAIFCIVGVFNMKKVLGLEVMKAKLVKGEWELLENTSWCNYPLKIYFIREDKHLYSIELNGQNLKKLTDFRINNFRFHKNKDSLLITQFTEQTKLEPEKQSITTQFLLNLPSLTVDKVIAAYNVASEIIWSPDDTQAVYVEGTDKGANKHERLLLYDKKKGAFAELYDIGLSPRFGIERKEDEISPPYSYYYRDLIGWSNDGKVLFFVITKINSQDDVRYACYKFLIPEKELLEICENKFGEERRLTQFFISQPEIYRPAMETVSYDNMYYLKSVTELPHGTIYSERGSLYFKNLEGQIECIAKFEGVRDPKFSRGFERPMELPDTEYCIAAFWTSLGTKEDNGYYLIDTKNKKIGKLIFLSNFLFKGRISWFKE